MNSVSSGDERLAGQLVAQLGELVGRGQQVIGRRFMPIVNGSLATHRSAAGSTQTLSLRLTVGRHWLTFSAPHRTLCTCPGGPRAEATMHPYRTHNCGELRAGHVGQHGAAVGLGAPQARSRPAAVHRPARPLRHHPDRVPARARVLRRGRGRPAGERADGHRPRGRAQRRDGQPRARDRRGRAGRRCPRGRVAGRDAAAAGQRRARLSRGDAAALPLPRPAPRDRCTRNILLRSRGHLEHPPAHGGAGLRRVPDADPDRELARGCPRLPGALAPASRQVLRAAAGAAAVQAAVHDRRASIATSRSRPAFATRTRAPTAARASSTSSTSRWRSSSRRTCSPRSSR